MTVFWFEDYGIWIWNEDVSVNKEAVYQVCEVDEVIDSQRENITVMTKTIVTMMTGMRMRRKR